MGWLSEPVYLRKRNENISFLVACSEFEGRQR
jgi:hypothetical protein